MREFIPVTDDMLYDNPALFERLVPYHVDRPCRHLASRPLHLSPADVQRDMVPAPRRGHTNE